MCKKGAERKRRRMAEAELQDSTERAFEAYGKPLETVSTFKYLGLVMTAGYDDWPALAGNLVKARKSWRRLSRILIREGADKRVSGNFFKAMVQAMLLFGEETWVLTPRIEWALESFLHRDARRITGKQPQREGGWAMDIPSYEGGHARGGVQRDSEGHHKELEYGRAIHCNATDYEPL